MRVLAPKLVNDAAHEARGSIREIVSALGEARNSGDKEYTAYEKAAADFEFQT